MGPQTDTALQSSQVQDFAILIKLRKFLPAHFSKPSQPVSQRRFLSAISQNPSPTPTDLPQTPVQRLCWSLLSEAVWLPWSYPGGRSRQGQHVPYYNFRKFCCFLSCAQLLKLISLPRSRWWQPCMWSVPRCFRYSSVFDLSSQATFILLLRPFFNPHVFPNTCNKLLTSCISDFN